MHLKKLEIQGFKSFPDKTVIKFEDNITAIVGPNGCGKSNISDAIRWVLGEQSIKNLRGSKMEDVIFSGTRKRRALSFAEVNIYFDNKDKTIPIEYNEVVVTRRMFRSGESEYYLNKSACRLKDIRTMFMDTGIGKDGYSIIGQGRIDEILSDKPEDRRNIFEEAAGIIKYKTKKEDSEKKLKNTEDNLTRINDLISEISSNNKKLKKESDKASQFIKTFEELKNLESNIYIRDIRDIEGKTRKLEDIIKGIQENINENRLEKSSKENVFEELKLDMEEKEELINSLRDKRENLLNSKDKSKNNLSLLIERENFNKENITRLEEEIKKIDLENSKLNNKIETLKASKAGNLKKYEKINLEQLKSKKHLEDAENNISLLEENLYHKEKEISILYEEIADKKAMLNNLDLSNESIEDEIREYNKENKKLYGEIKFLHSEIKSIISSTMKLKEEVEKLQDNKEILGKEYKDLQANLKENSKKIKEQEIKYEKTNSNYNLYKNMQNSYEGYFKSVKNLLVAIKNKKIKSDGFHGLVADLIKVDKKYETAINIALGGNLQNIVVDNEIKAKEMINYLKNNRLGRVTFLPLNTVKGKEYNISSYKFEDYGILGIANSLVQYEGKYKNIFKSLLGRTIIINNIDNAIKFAKKTGYKFRLVTLDGEVLNPGGSLSGGSYRSNISILNRKHKINEVKSSLEKLEKELKELNKYEEKLYADMELIDKKIKSTSNKIDELNTQIIKEDNEQESYYNKKDYISRNIKKNNHQIALIEKQKEEKVESSIKDEELLKSKEEKLINMRKDLSLNKEKLSNLNINREGLIEEINRVEIDKNIINKENINYSDTIGNHLSEIKEKKNSKTEKAKEIGSFEKKLRTLWKEKDELDKDITIKKRKELELKENINRNIQEKEVKLNSFYEEQNILKDINENISKLEKSQNDNSLSISKLELKRENIIEKLSDDYNLSLEQAYLLEKEIDNLTLAKERIQELKDYINKLGNINLSSIEEYKKVNSRLNFMETQQDDLIHSKENLEEIIKDMEKTMKTNFLESFHEINENFKQVFKELFDGGEARLELASEENNILTSGIDIKAKPPGKVLQSLSLLSGGEKSLVAVALLFAILKTKPAPFSILDEIDAALDDANINRYTSYLKKINKKTQFILITHRKVSMEIANVLYGVTMEEEGISKIISMELKDSKEELVS